MAVPCLADTPATCLNSSVRDSDRLKIKLSHRQVHQRSPRRLGRGQQRDTAREHPGLRHQHRRSEGGFAPSLNAQCLTLTASPDGKTVFVGGDFTQVNGQNRYRIAALDATTGALRAFAGSTDARVRALAVMGNTLYVGGIFSAAANQPRTRLAAFDTAIRPDLHGPGAP